MAEYTLSIEIVKSNGRRRSIGRTGLAAGLRGVLTFPGRPAARAQEDFNGEERLRRDLQAVDARPPGLLGRGRGGHPLGSALGSRLRRLAPALLSLVRRRRAQHLLQRR